MAARPYTRSLHPDDYNFLREWNEPIVAFQKDMVAKDVPHREWHPHRFWEYASIMQQLTELGVPASAEIIDIGAGASFFDPYLALKYPRLCCTDSMKYGDVNAMVDAQRAHYGVEMPLYDMIVEVMPSWMTGLFDVTLCISTIEHLDDHDKGFAEMVRITKPSGLLMITSDYFRDAEQFEQSVSRHLQVTDYNDEFVRSLPNRFAVDFVGGTDLGYRGDFVHNYSFCNICLRKRAS